MKIVIKFRNGHQEVFGGSSISKILVELFDAEPANLVEIQRIPTTTTVAGEHLREITKRTKLCKAIQS